MKIQVLPGISPKTEKWAENLLRELALPASEAAIHRYSHWECADEQCLQLKNEIERLRGTKTELLIGKSLGVIVGLQACQREVIAPQRAILIGTPVISCVEENLDLHGLAAALAVPALYLQQKEDVVGSCELLRKHVGSVEKATIVEVPGNNHQYKDLKLLVRHIRKWLGAV